MTQADRAAVLLGLACVDAVEIFDEDTPAAALGRLRPDIFAKDIGDAQVRFAIVQRHPNRLNEGSHNRYFGKSV